MALKDSSITKAILAIPVWERWFVCHVLERKKWKLARAYSEVTIDLIYSGHPFQDEMRILQENAWADVYGVDPIELPKH
jgi:hypothetical protein